MHCYNVTNQCTLVYYFCHWNIKSKEILIYCHFIHGYQIAAYLAQICHAQIMQQLHHLNLLESFGFWIWQEFFNEIVPNLPLIQTLKIKLILMFCWYAFINVAQVQYIPRNMHTVFALLCFVVVIHWLIFPYPSGLLHWHCGNLTIAPVPAKQPWWIWINTSCEFIMNDCITTTKQSTTKPCAYFLGYTVCALFGNHLPQF